MVNDNYIFSLGKFGACGVAMVGVHVVDGGSHKYRLSS